MRFAVQGKGGPDAEGWVAFAVEAYTAACDEAGLDPLLVVSQLLLETDNLTSVSTLLCVDPARLRSAKQEEAGRWFSSWREVARAHAGLLLAYALPAGGESSAQLGLLEEALQWWPVPQKLRGSAPTLDGFGGVWAADKDYAERIRRIANSILEPQY